MAIRRTATKLDSKFTTIPNDVLRDNRLTLKARGLLSLLMSHKVGWVVSIESLARENPEGKAAIRSAVNELEECGYLKRELLHSENGTFAGYDYVLEFEPSFDNQTPSCDYPTTGYPTTGYPTTDNRTPKNTIPKKTIEKKTIEEDTSSRKRDGAGYTPEFLRFWEAYPRKQDKGAAFKAWKKIPSNEYTAVMAGAHRYAADPNRVPQYTKHASSWLNARAWEDETPLPARHQVTSDYQDKVAYMVDQANRMQQRGMRELA